MLQAGEAVARHKGNVTNAANELKISRGTLQHRLRAAALKGITAGMVLTPEGPAPVITRDVELESMRRQLRDAQDPRVPRGDDDAR